MQHTKKDWVLVTGGSRGIGRGLVGALAKDYHVVFTYLSKKDIAEAFVAQIRDTGGQADAFQCNGRDPEQVKALAENCLQAFGSPYAVINNAGITRDALVVSMTDEAWRDVLSVNLDACFYMSRAFLPAMMGERRGVILLMSSVTAFKGNAGQVNYAATKGAMVGMARSMALEVARFKIRVNAIAPGLIATEMTENIPEKARNELQASIPLRRMGAVSEVVELARYLLSKPAAYITGQTIVIDGGLCA